MVLSRSIEKLGMKASENLVSGFRACGIVPLDSNAVLKKFPEENAENNVPQDTISKIVVEYLDKYKYSHGTKTTARGKKKKISVTPGKSVSAADLGLSLRETEPAIGLPTAAVAVQEPSNSSSEEHQSQPQASTATATLFIPTDELPGPSCDKVFESESESDDSESVVDSSEDEWVPPKAKKAKQDVQRNIFLKFS